MRTALKAGTSIRVPGNILYQITGGPIGEGGGGILYPVRKYLPDGSGAYTESPISYAMKECFPLSAKYRFSRADTGEIRPQKEDTEAWNYLNRAKEMQLAENTITGTIYHTAFRLTPVLETFQKVEISQDGGNTFQEACNSIAIMELLSEKGCSLKHYLKGQKHLPVSQAMRIIEQLLYAVREVHCAGYLHLDIQDGNIFLKGVLEDGSGMVSLIDFGSARKREADGFCEIDGILYSTPGFSAPEMRRDNDGSLRLGTAADIYSIGYLMLYLLTGRRFSAKELFLNQTGRYIPRFSIRKTRCPKHLVERMQSILAKALADHPQDRYADTEEMLAEVTDFLALLAPYRNPLSAAAYDAFICYRHGALDTPAARCLQNALEHYGKGGLPGRRPIRRVFLDEGELASCADFGERIREALKNTAWLIVLCSKATRESPWVNDEIEVFLEYHDVSRILAVIIEGEPSEVFPEALLKRGLDAGSLLAADARAGQRPGGAQSSGRGAADAQAGQKQQILRKIKGDVKLKIAAPMLQTTYDVLKQRRKLYHIRRASAAAGICLVLLSAFLGYAAVKSRQIADQAIQLAEEHQEALYGQALYLAEQAKQSYEKHDTAAAIRQALRAYDLLAGDGLFLPEAVHLLAEAMGVYTLPADAEKSMTPIGIFPLGEESSFSKENAPVKQKEEKNLQGGSGEGDFVDWQEGSGFKEYFLDSEGKFLFTADRSHVYVWDTASHACAKMITAPWTIERFGEEFLLEWENCYLLVLQDGLCCYDYGRDAMRWQYSFGQPMEGIAVSEDKSMAAVVTGQTLYLLSLADGTVLRQSALPITDGMAVKDTSVAISPDKNSIAFQQTGQAASHTEDLASNAAVPDAAALSKTILYNAAKNQYTSACSEPVPELPEFTQRSLSFTQDGQLYIIQGSGVNTIYEGQIAQYYSEKKTLKLSRYDPQQNRIAWSAERSYQALDETLFFLEQEEGGYHEILLAYGTQCDIFDAETGELLDACGMDAPIIQAWREEGKTAFVIENGDLLYRTDKENRLNGFTYFPSDVAGCQKRGRTYYIKSDAGLVQYQQGIHDTRYQHCTSLPEDLPAPSQEQESISTDGRYLAHITKDAVVLEDQTAHTQSALKTDTSPLSLCWLAGTDNLLLGFQDKVSLYRTATGTLSDTEPLEHSTYSRAAWQQIDNTTVLYIGDTYSYALYIGDPNSHPLHTEAPNSPALYAASFKSPALYAPSLNAPAPYIEQTNPQTPYTEEANVSTQNTEGIPPKILYSLKDLAAYAPQEDTFYFSSIEYDMDRLNEGLFSEGPQYGKIARYSMEEIINTARERLRVRE